MDSILVTTDFSAASGAAIRFAIRISEVNHAHLTFFHSAHLTRRPSVSGKEDASQAREQLAALRLKLNIFISRIYKKLQVRAGTPDCVVSPSDFPQVDIREYALKHRFTYICMSTRGSGKFARFLGTNTANTICFSSVPVIAVPSGYRGGVPAAVMYASDLADVGREIKRVVAFASPLNASIQLLHFIPATETFTGSDVKPDMGKLTRYPVKLNIRHLDYLQTVLSRIKSEIKKNKPSMLVMFTDQNRTLFQRLFHPSRSAQFTFDSRIPILVFNKQ